MVVSIYCKFKGNKIWQTKLELTLLYMGMLLKIFPNKNDTKLEDKNQ